MYPIVQAQGSHPSSMSPSRRPNHEQQASTTGTPARNERSPRIEEEQPVFQPTVPGPPGARASGLSGLLTAVVLWDFAATDEEEVTIKSQWLAVD